MPDPTTECLKVDEFVTQLHRECPHDHNIFFMDEDGSVYEFGGFTHTAIASVVQLVKRADVPTTPEDVEEAEHWLEHQCQCRLCFCRAEVETPGDVCISCQQHAHQG